LFLFIKEKKKGKEGCSYLVYCHLAIAFFSYFLDVKNVISFVNTIFVNISFVHNKTVHKMKKQKKQEGLPVSQRQLAQYLGISSSMMHMAESSRHPSHQLSAAASGKLTALVLAHLQQQKKRGGRSWQKLQGRIIQDVTKKRPLLEATAIHTEAKVKVLANRLKQMKQQEAADRQWLNTIDHLLAKPADTKAGQADRKWLANQQALAEARLLKHSWLQQAKLEVQIEQEQLKAAGIRKLLKQLKMKEAGM
jgi:transcriptional regulator with XRE-family HTH domain